MLVLFICPNPALDRAAMAPGARHGGTVRASAVVEEAGGKAMHAARVAAALGADVRVVAPLGGESGARIRELLADEGIELLATPLTEPTRRTYTVVDDEAADVVEVIEPSPRLSPEEAAAFHDDVTAACHGAGIVACAGSLPAGLAPSFLSGLVAIARAAGARSLIDAGGPALRHALEAAPDLVKPNVGEARAVVGEDGDAAAALLRAGARAALVTDGPRGATLTAAAGWSEDLPHAAAWHLSAPARPVVNAVGCGDAVLGGIAAGLASGLSLLDAVVLGMAAAADKVGRLGSGHIDPLAARAAVGEVRTSRRPT